MCPSVGRRGPPEKEAIGYFKYIFLVRSLDVGTRNKRAGSYD